MKFTFGMTSKKDRGKVRKIEGERKKETVLKRPTRYYVMIALSFPSQTVATDW